MRGVPLRTISNTLKEQGFQVSYGSVFRHKKYVIGNVSKHNPYKYYNEDRQPLTTLSFKIEIESLQKLQQEAREKRVSLSLVINYHLHKWFTPKNKEAFQDLIDIIFQYRIKAGWFLNGRRKYKNAVRISITLDKENKKELNVLLSKMALHIYYNKSHYDEKVKQLIIEKRGKPYPKWLSCPRFELYGYPELINIILSLSI